MNDLRNTIGRMRGGSLGAISVGYFARHTSLSASLDRLRHMEEKVGQPQQSRLTVVEGKVASSLDTGTCVNFSRADWRIVPWVMWRGAGAADHGWFLDALFAYIKSSGAKSVVRSLVQAYIQFFDSAKQSVVRVARFLLSDGLKVDERNLERWLALHRTWALFDPEHVANRLGRLVLEGGDLFESLKLAGIGGDKIDAGLARAAFQEASKVVALMLGEGAEATLCTRAIDRLIRWGTTDSRNLRYPGLFGRMATDLLEPLRSPKVDIDVQEQVVRFLVDIGGDPRVNAARWSEVKRDTLAIAFRILIRSTLEDFTRIIDATADNRHWRDRKPFWLAYHEIGAIDDIWVAFGPRAISRAGQLEGRYAQLQHASDKAHSALIIRIKDLIIVEWSHNGRCRFFSRGAGTWSPELYARAYDFPTLHANAWSADSYRYHSSGWETAFARKIFEETQIRHPRYGSGK